jgi:hypothetical protein
MDGSGTDRVADHVAAGETDAAREALADLAAAAPDDRKATLRSLGSLAEEQPSRFDGLAPTLAAFLTDDVRAIRLTTAKVFVSLAESDPSVVVPAVDSLAARLADNGEFYYVRARSAEALGYVALDRPETVASPEILADLRIGLAFEAAALTCGIRRPCYQSSPVPARTSAPSASILPISGVVCPPRVDCILPSATAQT